MRASHRVRSALAALLLHLGTGAVRADPVPYRIDGLPRGETLSIRAEPDPSAEVVGEVRVRALVAGCTNDTPSRTTWCRVKVGRVVGWARRRYLAPE